MKTQRPYKISTDQVILDHVRSSPDGECIVFIAVGCPVLYPGKGIVTSLDKAHRTLTVQTDTGMKRIVTFDIVTIPETDEESQHENENQEPKE